MRPDGKALLQAAGWAAWTVIGLSGLLVGLEIAGDLAGIWGLALASALFPLTLAAAPWYALFAWNAWTPLLVVYGGGALATTLLFLARQLPPGLARERPDA